MQKADQLDKKKHLLKLCLLDPSLSFSVTKIDKRLRMIRYLPTKYLVGIICKLKYLTKIFKIKGELGN